MVNKIQENLSLAEVHSSVDARSKGSRWKQIFIFLGPAYLVSVGYMDPGNWATDLAGGSGFGYALLWVLVLSNLMALLLQSLSARLGIVRNRDLAQANRETYPRLINICLYILAEIAIAACDLAEVLGMAIGINLLTGLPLSYGVLLTILDTFLLLFLQRLGMRKMEAFVIGLIAVMGGAFLIEILLAKPSLAEIGSGLVPSLPGPGALYIAIAIIGATVMPHNLYLHSALVQTRKIQRDNANIRRAIRFNMLDSTIALNLAFLVNAAILILAACLFFKSHHTNVAELKQAYLLLPSLLGVKFAAVLFAVALIAAGQSSTITGTLAGQIVMEGYLQLRINPWLRRLLTRVLAIIPSLIVILWFGEKAVDRLLIFSQVILSVQLGFAVIPLIHFVSDKKTMGEFSIGAVQKTLSWAVAALLLYLNIKYLYESLSAYLSAGRSPWIVIFILLTCTSLVFLLLYILFQPWILKKVSGKSILMHADSAVLSDFTVPDIRNIAVALDFSGHDEKLIAYALKQGNKHSRYILIHVVESASAHMLGRNSDDYETRKDHERLELYGTQLRKRGYDVYTFLGFQHRAKEIVRIAQQEHADMLVIGSHGHVGIKDLIYGETVDAVRHDLDIPVLVIHR